jgi:hypothetical protein
MENKIIKAGTKIVIGTFAGQCGTDSMEGFLLTQDYTEEELEKIAWECGLEHASMYGIYPSYELEEMSDEDLAEIDEDDYTDNIEGWWKVYNEKEHKEHITYGSAGPTFREL